MPFGGTTSADDYLTGTRAAAIGGTTTVIDFALQSRGHTLAEALDTWDAKAAAKACIDYSLHMAITDLGANGEALAEMEAMVDRGITSFKLFMAYPNVLMIDDGLMFQVMQKAASLGALILVHAENGGAIDVVVAQALAAGHTAPHFHALTRSVEAEAEATHRAVALAHMAGATVYIVHLSNADSLRELRAAQAKRSPRPRRNLHPIPRPLARRPDARPQLRRGQVRLHPTPPQAREPRPSLASPRRRLPLCSLHRPLPLHHRPESLGKDDFSKIPNGGPGIENRLQLLWHHGVNTGLLTPERFVALTSAEPARIFGMDRKGAIAPGKDADILLWNPNADYTISAATQSMNTDYSMFEGWQIKGNVASVYSRGELIVDGSAFIGQPGPRPLLASRGECFHALAQSHQRGIAMREKIYTFVRWLLYICGGHTSRSTHRLSDWCHHSAHCRRSRPR